MTIKHKQKPIKDNHAYYKQQHKQRQLVNYKQQLIIRNKLNHKEKRLYSI